VRPLGTISAAEALEQDLRRRILQGEFGAGEHLREVELADEYKVGRHTLRAAFDRLVHCGVLARERNRGAFVRELTAADLREIYGLRTALEVEAVRILAAQRVVPEDARRLTAELDTLSAKSPRVEVIEADLGFHRALVRGTGNERLASVHHELGSEIRLCLAQLADRYATPREIADEHLALLAPIERGRVQASERAIRAHFARAVDWLVERAETAPPAVPHGV
jgi:DNA-binding GntR family transcriptional regulator